MTENQLQWHFYFTMVEEKFEILTFDIRKFYLRVKESDLVVRTLSGLKTTFVDGSGGGGGDELLFSFWLFIFLERERIDMIPQGFLKYLAYQLV